MQPRDQRFLFIVDSVLREELALSLLPVVAICHEQDFDSSRLAVRTAAVEEWQDLLGHDPSKRITKQLLEIHDPFLIALLRPIYKPLPLRAVRGLIAIVTDALGDVVFTFSNPKFSRPKVHRSVLNAQQ